MGQGIVDERRNFFEKMNELHSRKDRIGSSTLLTELSHESIPRSIPVISKIKHVPYQVYVSTAGYKSAGTDKPVYIQISGDFGNTEYILLDDASPNIIESGMHYANPDSIDPGQVNYGFPSFSVRDFRFNAALVGNVANISLRHDPQGYEHSAWRPENILVVSIHLQRAWLFTSPKWLSYEGGNQISLKPTTVVYAGRRSCRNVSQALLALKSQYAKVNILSDMENSTKNFDKSYDLRLLHPRGIKNGDTQKVRFQLQKFTKTSAHMYLLGNIEALGKWDPERAVRMNMILSSDGIWRGDWTIELDLDNDFDEFKYTYLTMVESRNEDHRRYIHYGDVHNLNLSTLVSSQKRYEDWTIATYDKYESGQEEEIMSSAFCEKQVLDIKKPRENVLEELKKPSYQSSQSSSPHKSSSGGDLSTNNAEIQHPGQKLESKTKNLDSVQHGSSIKDNKEAKSGESRTENPVGIFQLQQTSIETKSCKIAEPEAEDLEHTPGYKNEPSRAKLRKLLYSSHQQLLQSSNDIKNSRSEIEMLKNNTSLERDSFSRISKQQSDHTNSLFLKQVSLNLERYKKISTGLSMSIRKELIDIKEKITIFYHILDENAAQLRAAIQMKEKNDSKVFEKYFSEREHLEELLQREYEEKKGLFNKLQDLQGNIRVFCRIRPLLDEEKGENKLISGLELLDEIPDNQSEVEIAGKSFKFQCVFSPSSSQYDVYEKTSGVVRSVLDGYNVCIMAYGQTGSGKTFTMNGTKDNKGVNYRALEDLFKVAIDRSSQYNTLFSISVLEIYNETLRDLLETKDQQKKLDIRKDPSSSGRAVFVQNLKRVEVANAQNSWNLMEKAMENRITEKTEMNESSSRSHFIFKVYVNCEQKRNGSRTSGDLTFVDLAGSERVTRSKVSGERLKEAQNINKSLSTLGDVFNALISRTSHVPFRNSKLTYLLQDSIGGPSKTLMFFNISPSMKDFAESISTLQFSQRVAKVELGVAHKNIMKKDESEVHKSIQSKEAELRSLRSKYANIENDNKKKAVLLRESEKKSRVLEEELRRAKNSLECSRQNERDLRINFEKKMKEKNTRQTASYGLPLFKDAKRNHQKKQQNLMGRDRNFIKKHNEYPRQPFSSPVSSHKKKLEASSRQHGSSKSSYMREARSEALLANNVTKEDQKTSHLNSSVLISRSASSRNEYSSSFTALPRSLSSDSKIPSQISTETDHIERS